jgi:hypothetical protein
LQGWPWRWQPNARELAVEAEQHLGRLRGRLVRDRAQPPETVQKRQRRDPPDVSVEVGVGLDRVERRRERRIRDRGRHELEVSVSLARAGRRARVVEGEPALAQTGPERLEIAAVERRLLVLEVARDDQRVVLDHGELVQDT